MLERARQAFDFRLQRRYAGQNRAPLLKFFGTAVMRCGPGQCTDERRSAPWLRCIG